MTLLGTAVDEEPLSKCWYRSELAWVIASEGESLVRFGDLVTFPYEGVEISAEMRATGILAVGGLSA